MTLAVSSLGDFDELEALALGAGSSDAHDAGIDVTQYPYNIESTGAYVDLRLYPKFVADLAKRWGYQDDSDKRSQTNAWNQQTYETRKYVWDTAIFNEATSNRKGAASVKRAIRGRKNLSGLGDLPKKPLLIAGAAIVALVLLKRTGTLGGYRRRRRSRK